MHASDLTFGIEFETTMPLSYPVGGYSARRQAAGLPAGWIAKTDSSIHAGRGRKGCEFVSPVLKGAEGLAQVIEVVNKINEMGGRVNRSTGLHIHVGWPREFGRDEKALARVVSIVSNHERAIYASTGTKARETGRWCNGVQRHGDARRAIDATGTQRYHLLNLTNLRSFWAGVGRKPTVEFRAFAGTLNVVKVVGYIRLCLGLVERGLTTKRTTSFATKQVADKSPVRRSGEGQTQITRLFYQLGWTRGRVSRRHGDVTCDGAPDYKAIKKEFMRLAKKYDSQ